MTVVLDAIKSSERALPEKMTTIESNPLTPEQQGSRILRAHETLIDLSEANEEQFRAVVESLRADLS
jgi:hypothetical protein